MKCRMAAFLAALTIVVGLTACSPSAPDLITTPGTMILAPGETGIFYVTTGTSGASFSYDFDRPELVAKSNYTNAGEIRVTVGNTRTASQEPLRLRVRSGSLSTEALIFIE